MFKLLGVSLKCTGMAMKDFEILLDETGVPAVALHGEARAAADAQDITIVHT